MHFGKAAYTLSSRTPGSRLTGYYSTIHSLQMLHLLQWTYLKLYFKGNTLGMNIHGSKSDCPLENQHKQIAFGCSAKAMDCIIFYLKLECFTLLSINALIRYVGNSSSIAFTPCCTLNCPCHLKFMLYVRKIEPQFSAYLFKIITFQQTTAQATLQQLICKHFVTHILLTGQLL